MSGEDGSGRDRVEMEAGSERGRDADEPHEIPAKGWRDVALRVKDELKTDHVALTSAGVAFFGFLALVPLIIAGVSLYGLFADPSQVTSLVDRMGSSVPREVSNLIEEQLTSIVSSSSGALGVGAIVSIAGALWAASSGISHLNESLNIAYDEDEGRPFWKKRLLALAMTIGFLVFLAVAVSIVGASAQLGSGLTGLLSQAVGWLLVAALFALVLSVLYRYGPDRDEPEWSWVTWGAAVATVLGVIVSIGFGFYVSRFGSYNETYGSLAAIVVTLMWLYLTSIVVLVGAEINAEMEHQTAKDTTQGPDEPRGRRGAHVADHIGSSPDS